MRYAILVIVLFTLSTAAYAASIDARINVALEKEEEVPVIVVMKKGTNTKTMPFDITEFKKKRDLDTINAVVGKMTKKGLGKLQRDPRVSSVQLDKQVRAFLNESGSLINSNLTWALSINNTNITGKGETVCVIDSGIDYNHTALGGGWGNRVISGYNYCANDACSQENNDPYDNHGHGTHVAGIVASNDSTYRGIAFEANLIAIKVLNSTGIGFDSDVISGINWCINNATKFNITVISMSLGSSSYTGYCDANETAYRDAINTAISNNISVVVASGNSASNTSISAPACIQNATSVGAVYDDNIGSISFAPCTDSTTAADKITCYTDRNSLLDLLAPGSKINSTLSGAEGGGFGAKHGTSMAAPHVSAAFALLHQYKRLENGTLLRPPQIEDTLKKTGTNVSDSRTGVNFSRINIYRSIVFLDAFLPSLSVSSPTNRTYNITNISLDYLANDNIALDTCTFTNTTGSASTLSNCPNATFMAAANRQNNVTITVNDTNGNLNSSQIFFTVDTIIPLLNMTEPQNTTYKTNNITLNFSASDSNKIDRCWFVNVTGSTAFLNDPRGNCTATTFIANNNTLNNITVYVNDTGGNVNSTNLFFTVNITFILAVQQPTNTTYATTNISINYTIGGFDTCWLVSATGGRIDLQGCTNVTILAPANQFNNVTIFANDSSGNTTSSQIFFTTDTLAPSINFTLPAPNNETINTTNDIIINLTISEQSVVLLEWNGTNITMNGSGLSRFYNHVDLADGNYTFRAYANDSVGNANFTAFRWVYINATRNFTSYINNLNTSLSANNIILTLLNSTGGGDASVVFVDVNYTFRFNVSGIITEIVNFSWLQVNTSNLVNVTRNITMENITNTFNLGGGVLDNYVWVDLNNFTAENYTPKVTFIGNFRLNYYLSGSRNEPNLTRINETCNANPSNRPCYSFSVGTTSLYLLTFSGAAVGNDTQAPAITIVSPSGTYTNSNISLRYSISDNVAADTCWYSLNSGANVTPVNCTNTTFVASSGSNILVLYANDSSGNQNSSTVTFTYNPPATPVTSGSGGGGGGSMSTISPGRYRKSWDTITSLSGFSVGIDSIPVRFVTIKVNITAKSPSIMISAEKSAPVVLDNVYQYFSINATNLPNQTVAELTFVVNKSWIEMNNYDKNNTRLNRFDNGWILLPTYLLNGNSTHLMYKSLSPGFSYFAITGEIKPSEIIRNDTTGDITAVNETTNKTEERPVCAQVITPAVKGDECVNYPTPCDVPPGWTVVQECHQDADMSRKDMSRNIAAALLAIIFWIITIIACSILFYKFFVKRRK